MWYRLLLPSWDFFAQPGHRARIDIRFNESDPWRPLWPPLKRKSWHLLLNPQGNAHHWANRLAQELLLNLTSLGDPKDLIATPAYQIVQAEAEGVAQSASSLDFSFRLVAIDSHGKEEVVMTSPLQTLSRSQ